MREFPHDRYKVDKILNRQSAYSLYENLGFWLKQGLVIGMQLQNCFSTKVCILLLIRNEAL